MLGIEITYTEYPDSIIFKIGPNGYVLIHNSTGNQYPYDLFHVGYGQIETANVDEWIALHTGGHCSLDILLSLAKAHSSGRESAYSLLDIESCADTIFKHLRSRLFVDGFAGRYADTCDIECMSMTDLREALQIASTMNVKERIPNRADRFRHVCEKNGYTDMAIAWERILSRWGCGKTTKREDANTPALDDELSSEIRKLVRSEFDKHAKHEPLINDCKRRRLSGTN
jgi:hypothetical protein